MRPKLLLVKLFQIRETSGEAGRKAAPRKILTVLNVRSLLSVGQIALSIVLLISATLLLESVAYLCNVNVGFNPANLLTVSISLPLLRYDTDQKRASFFEELSHRMGSLPGIRGAAAAMSLPMIGYAGIPVQDAAKPQLRLNERLIAKVFLSRRVIFALSIFD